MSEKIFPESLCHRCRWVRYIHTKRQTTYLMCTSRVERYFSQPICSCEVFVAKEEHEKEESYDGELASQKEP